MNAKRLKPPFEQILLYGLMLAGLLSPGCKGEPFIDHLAGNNMSASPHFFHKDVFMEGDDLYTGLDPVKYASKVGSSFRIYVTEHKTYSQWDSNPALIDVTGSVESSTLSAGSLANNRHLVWANMSMPAAAQTWHKHYDIVYDFNNNNQYDKTVDVIDRIGTLEIRNGEESGGFTLFKDPAQTGDYPVGTHLYNTGNFTVSTPATYVEAGDPKTISMIGKMYYPAMTTGANTAVSTIQNAYPVIIIAHGRHSVSTL